MVQSVSNVNRGVGTVGTGRLVFYLALAVTTMAADQRGRYVALLHRAAQSLAGPVYWLASAPSRATSALAENLSERRNLVRDNRLLREQLLELRARAARSDAAEDENQRLRRLLRAHERLGLQARLARIVEVELDPFRQRVLIDRGSASGAQEGQAVMDDRGVIGQVREVDRLRSEVVLITDASHALPVTVVRTGLRTIAFGAGERDSLRLPYIPFSADVVVGDELVTSGLGGRFPAGLPVGTIHTLKPGDAGTFAVGTATPASGIAMAGAVLLLSEQREPLVYEDGRREEPAGPPEALAGSAREPASASSATQPERAPPP